MSNYLLQKYRFIIGRTETSEAHAKSFILLLFFNSIHSSPTFSNLLSDILNFNFTPSSFILGNLSYFSINFWQFPAFYLSLSNNSWNFLFIPTNSYPQSIFLYFCRIQSLWFMKIIDLHFSISLLYYYQRKN